MQNRVAIWNGEKGCSVNFFATSGENLKKTFEKNCREWNDIENTLLIGWGGTLLQK